MKFIQKHYRVLDINLSLESDSRELFQLFDLYYSWSTVTSPGVENQLKLSVVLDPENRKPYIQNDNKCISLEHYPERYKFGYYYIQRQVMKHLKNYVLLHAGVASKPGQTVIIAGPSGMGKTTMIVELLKKGFRYFSDDICPVSLKTGLVHPFPRSLWKVSGKTEDTSRQDCFIRSHKESYPATDFGFQISDSPEKPVGLFYLTDGRQEDNSMRLLVKGNDSIINRLRPLENVEIKRLENVACPEWSIIYPRGQGLTQKIENILDELRNSVDMVFRIDPISPDYDKEPELTKISTPEMAFKLIKQMQNRDGFAERDADTKPGLRMMEICGLFEKVPCYVLKVGRLESMLNLVLDNS